MSTRWRAHFHPEWTRLSICRFRYTRVRNEWSLYLRGRQLKFDEYDLDKSAPHINEHRAAVAASSIEAMTECGYVEAPESSGPKLRPSRPRSPVFFQMGWTWPLRERHRWQHPSRNQVHVISTDP